MTTATLSISTFHFPGLQDKISHFEMKLTDVAGKLFGIPEAECEAIVRMPWAAFSRICKGLSTIGGDTVEITVTREGVRFSSRVDLGTAQIICRHKTTVDKPEEVTIIELEEPVSLTLSLEGMNSSAEAQSHWQAMWQSTCCRICRWFLS